MAKNQLAPACASAGQPLAWSAVATATGLLAEADAVALRQRRVWVDAEMRNDGAGALNMTLLLTFDPRPDGSVSFGQAGQLFVPVGATGHTVLTAWVRPGVETLAVRVVQGDADAARHANLRLRCAGEIEPGGEPSRQQALLDEMLDLYFDNALHLPSDTSALRREAQALATGAVDRNDIHWAMRAAMFMAGDRHSYIVPPAGRDAFFAMLAPAPPRVELRADGLALVAVSQVGFDDEQARRDYARRLYDAVSRVAARHPKGWIVDLRGFGGGDMWTTLAGLSALVDGPLVGEFVERGGRVPWLVAGGRSGTTAAMDFVASGAAARPAIDRPVAVLIGPHTGSSGETTAIAFEHRPCSRFFGQPTLGIYNSGVVPHTLSDGTLFGIAQTLNADRTGHVYDGAIVPDVLVPESANPVNAAAAWLLQQRR